MLSFNTVNELFKNDQISDLARTEDGIKFLKLRSLSRKSLMKYLVGKYSINITNVSFRGWLKIVYESNLQLDEIDESILEIYETERANRRASEEQLVSELYKIQSFEWGGLHQNSLERAIVNNYVKKITSYEMLSNAIEHELYSSMRAYVLASWYNHWTSIIIEDIFQDHENVIPAVGRIKKIDFFIKNKPFDLKVTYLPEGFIKESRKAQNLRPELTLMKQTAKQLEIGFDQSVADSVLIQDLWQKLEDHPHQSATNLITEIQEFREMLLNSAMANPEFLVRWLYENQGVRRFDASNRLFLVLVDKKNFFNSWKLKRAKPLISETVNSYLNQTSESIGFSLDFNWEGQTYNAESDIIFVIKP